MNFTGPIEPDYTGPNYNNFWDATDITYESGTVTEPVTVQEVKNYLRLEGFVDINESPADSISDSEFDYDDSLIGDFIKAGRELFEQKCGLSLVPKTIQAMITNMCGEQEILYGPVRTISELLDSDGNAITTFTTSGVQWKRLMTPRYKDMKITYEAGYTTIPAPIKIDLLRTIAFMYINRGDMDAQVDEFTGRLAGKYSRNSYLK